MAWTISDLKTRSLAAVKAHYWPCVAAALIASVASGGCNFKVNLGRDGGNILTSVVDFSSPLVWTVIAVIVLVIVVLAVLSRLFLLNPVTVGCNGFFLDNAAGKAEFSAIAAPFRSGWKRVVKTMFLRDLYLFLWSLPALLALLAIASGFLVGGDFYYLIDPDGFGFAILAGCFFASSLLAIPFFVKTYSYRLVPYLLAAAPSATGNAAVTRSRVMMDGHKFHAFLLDLSFLGWFILGLFTCGILCIFFVFPWKAAADAALYLALATPDSPASAAPSLPPPLPQEPCP